MKIKIFDIEANGKTPDKIWCVAVKDLDSPNVRLYSDYSEDAIPLGLVVNDLNDADLLVAHNGIMYDDRVLQRLLPAYRGGKIFDTLLYSRAIYTFIDHKFYDKIFPKVWGKNSKGKRVKITGHSLAAWGKRLSVYKTDFGTKEDAELGISKWDHFDESMLEYCAQDVRVCEAIYKFITTDPYSVEVAANMQQGIALEEKVAAIVAQQIENGVLFDVDAAVELEGRLILRLEELYKEFEQRTGLVKLKKNKGISNAQVIAYLQKTHGWKGKKKTPSGKPALGHEVIEELPYPEMRIFQELKEVEKMLSFLSTGAKGWLGLLDENNLIHGSIIPCGTVTGRAAHKDPNLGNVPKPGFGRTEGYNEILESIRKLFIVNDGRKMVGVDMSGVQLRSLGHYLTPFDGGLYSSVAGDPSKDIHTLNMKAAGLDDRNRAKTFIYAWLFGATAGLLSGLLECSYIDAKRTAERFERNTKGLAVLQRKIISRHTEKGFVRGLDGRELRVNADYILLNRLLQAAEAVLMKQAMVDFWESEEIAAIVATHGKDSVKQILWVHDEVEFDCLDVDGIPETVKNIMIRSIENAGDKWNFKCRLAGEGKIGRNWGDVH